MPGNGSETPERGEPALVTFTQIAQLVTERGYVSRPITRQGVRYIADHDPDWPVPKDQWMKLGNALVMPWPPVERFFRERTRRGRGPAEKNADEGTGTGSAET